MSNNEPNDRTIANAVSPSISKNNEIRAMALGISPDYIYHSALTYDGRKPHDLSTDNKIVSLLAFQNINNRVYDLTDKLTSAAKDILKENATSGVGMNVVALKVFNDFEPALVEMLNQRNVTFTLEEMETLVGKFILDTDDGLREAIESIEVAVERFDPANKMDEPKDEPEPDKNEPALDAPRNN